MMRLSRNIINHFSRAGVSKNISRTKFKMPFTHTTTFNSGKLIPFFMQECVPGDTVQVNSTSMIARMQTPLVPVMDSAYLDYWFFFVPTRLVWDNFKEFMGENKLAAWSNNLPVRRIPVIPTNEVANEIKSKSAADYLGLPLGRVGAISAIPFRSIRQVWNDWFMSTAIDDPLLINTGDSEPRYSVGPQNFDLLPISKFPDYFTTALPSPQFGEPVSIGLLGNAPVYSGDYIPEDLINKSVGTVFRLPGTYNDIGYFDPKFQTTFGAGGDGFTYDNHYLSVDIDSQPVESSIAAMANSYPVNLNADLSSAGAITINDLRVAFQIQKYKEAQARGGSRYVEILESIWSVRSPDARLQRSEYIGGDRVLINMQQVLKTSAGESDPEPQGFASGFSKTSTRGGSFEFAVPEHGLVLGFVAIRPTHSYQQGMDRYWKKRDLFDFYNPMLAHIGETPVYEYEIFANGLNTQDDNLTVFGYQEAYADYRWKRSYVSGEMRSGIENSLDIYHYADFYDTPPTLSAGWLHEDTSLIDRTLAVSSNVADQFLVDIYVDLDMIRPLPAYSIPGLIDHA